MDGSWSGKFGKGLKKDTHDANDKMFAPHLAHVELPKKQDKFVEFLQKNPFDQGQIGSCTGNGSAAALTIRLNESKYKYAHTPSRLFIYYNARMIEDCVNDDAGAMIRDVFKGMALYGSAPEDSAHDVSWPYSSTDERYKEKPPQAVYDNAKKYHLLLEYSRVSLRKESLKQALCEGPVVFGLDLRESFESDKVARTGRVPSPKRREGSLGGHCMMSFGYGIVDKNCVDALNSWGLWGNRGTCAIPFEVMEEFGSDAWTPKLLGMAKA